MKRNTVGGLGLLKKSGLRVFRTGDFALLAGLSGQAATKALARLAGEGLVVKVRRGIWVSRLADDVSPYELVPHLTAPWPVYVSLFSVLSDSGVVEEIPQVTYAVTSGRPAVYATPLGQIRVHHLPPGMMWGSSLRQAGRGTFPSADKEKAFLDLAYLALTRRSPLRLPEKRGRAWRLDKAKLRAYAARFDHPALTGYLKKAGLI